MKGGWRGWRERHVGAAAGRGGQFVFVPANSRFPPPPPLPPFCTHADDLKSSKPPLIEIAVLLCSRVGADDRVEEERKGGTVGSNACVRVRWDGRKGPGGGTGSGRVGTSGFSNRGTNCQLIGHYSYSLFSSSHGSATHGDRGRACVLCRGRMEGVTGGDERERERGRGGMIIYWEQVYIYYYIMAVYFKVSSSSVTPGSALATESMSAH